MAATKMKMVSKAPDPIQRKGKSVCPVTDCGKDFPSEGRYRMHYFRAHDEAFKQKWLRSQAAGHARRKAGSAPPAATPDTAKPVGGKMLNHILTVLGKNKHRSMNLDEILTGIKSNGFQSKGQDVSTKTYIAQVIRKNPESGVQYADGLYSINKSGAANGAATVKPTKRKRKVIVDPTPVPATSLEVELAIAQRQALKNQEISMKLFEALTIAMG